MKSRGEMAREGTALGVLCAVFLIGCADVGQSDSPADVASTRGAILGGMDTNDYVFVGALAERPRACGQVPRIAICTVALIAPDRVLTAGHCVEPYHERQLEVRFGAELGDAAVVTRAVVEHTMHPLYDGGSSDHDLAILRLASPVDITPVALASAPLDASFSGAPITLIGFGATDTQPTRKREGATLVDSMEAFSFRYLPTPAMTCRGDSGGPALLDVAGTPTLVGVTSAGDATCTEYGVDVRVDANYDDFIGPTLALPAPTPGTILALDALCDALCESDAECPDALVCQVDATGAGRCVFPQAEPGRFDAPCSADADCGSGQCIALPEGCLCYTPCPVPDAGVEIDAGTDASEDGGAGHAGGGCSLTGGRSGGAAVWLGLLALGIWWQRRPA